MNKIHTGAAIERAMKSAQLSQRELAQRTGISQSTLSRIISGHRTAKMPEIIQIAHATGSSVARLTGTGVSERVQCAARSTNGSSMEAMRQKLLDFIELDSYLDDQGIPEVR